jgi:hypothetical protein
MKKHNKYWLISSNDSIVSFWSPVRYISLDRPILGIAIMNGPFKGIYLRNIHHPQVVKYRNSNHKAYCTWVGPDMCIKKAYYDMNELTIKFNNKVYIQKIQLEHEQFKIVQEANGWDVVFKSGSGLVRRSIKN